MLAGISRLLVTGASMICVCYANAQFSNYRPPMQDTRHSSALNIYLGGTTFLGDLGGNKGPGEPFIKDYDGRTIRPYVGVSYAYFPYSWLSVKGGLHYTSITGADSLSDQTPGHSLGRYERNLSFKSAIAELSAEVEWYPIQMLWQYEEAAWRPFISTGVGVFHFNPKTKLNGQWIELQPLHLEGQGFAEYPERKNYKLNQLFIPLSFGLKYRVNNNIFIAVSSTFRRTFTDYIDDASTTYIDPNLFDKYLTADKAKLAKQLYYRGNTTSETSTPGPYRGYGSADSYTTLLFTITYLFGSRGDYGYNIPY